MIKVGTDFSGIGSPEQALKDLGVKHEVIFSCEIDKYARLSYENLHGQGKVYEDITKRNHDEVEQLDLYVAGFPCQSFSMAGKRLGFEDIRGTLFFNVADFIRVNGPNCFILENVKGLLSHDKGRTFQTIIDLLSNCGGTVNGQILLDFFEDGLGYHVFYQVLNTKEHGLPQNRERIFIVGFKNYKDFHFPKKEELKLKLKDILEPIVDEKYYLSDKMLEKIVFNGKEKGIIANLNKRGQKGEVFSDNSNNISCLSASDYKQPKQVMVGYVNQDTQASKIISDEGISPNICAGTHGYANGYVVHNLQPRTGDPKKGGTGHLSKNDGTAYCVDTGCSQGVEIPCVIKFGRTDEGKKIRKENLKNGVDFTPFQEKEISNIDYEATGTLTSSQKDNLVLTNRIRRLTPLECWRLQGFSDKQFYKAQAVISDTQLYKQAGNTISVNVIRKIINQVMPHL